jgi:hypothetical protein
MYTKSRLPSLKEIQALVAFLPRLFTEGFEPVKEWHGGTQNKDGMITMPWPEYDPLVEEFFRLAASECWLDYSYRPEEAARMLENQAFVRRASLSEIKTMMTYCVRGERFSDGHWGEMIQNGSIRRLLERLMVLGEH